jgi:hypothetical protein
VEFLGNKIRFNFLDLESVDIAIGLSGHKLGELNIRISKSNYAISKPPIKMPFDTKKNLEKALGKF